MSKYSYCLVACARWETDTIQEWLLYHRSIGFEHVYLYCNDDDASELYEKVMPFNMVDKPFVTFNHHHIQGDQKGMYNHFLDKYAKETEYFIFLDVDEFICIRNINNIDNFVKGGFRDCDDIYFNWLSFGPNGHLTRPKGSVLENYTRRDKSPFVLTKHLVKTASFFEKQSRDHLPPPFHHAFSASENWIAKNVLGEDMMTYLSSDHATQAHYLSMDRRGERIIETACIFHYAFKSLDDLERRVRRGLKGAFVGQKIWQDAFDSESYVSLFESLNTVEDTYLQEYWNGLVLNGVSQRTLPGKAISLNKARLGNASQSSVSKWSLNEDPQIEAQGAISGSPTGGYQFHTDADDTPWWALKFPEVTEISQIIIYNRMDVPHRANNIVVECCSDDGIWQEVGAWNSDTPFGGIDGKPFVIDIEEKIKINGIRIRGLFKDYLHLDQVEIY
ncbi:glycosyltransferase family 2 protein [Neoasaia chiangmaiensis]|uniref:glycosyltransferase family 2 protein n=1 Tax=Neoasaia chiangmaiensis TaxID=320497 RepID=UPI00098A97FE|nr:glycosyltransferase family 2 protein [Neoasaia chiangmaiensis]